MKLKSGKQFVLLYVSLCILFSISMVCIMVSWMGCRDEPVVIDELWGNWEEYNRLKILSITPRENETQASVYSKIIVTFHKTANLQTFKDAFSLFRGDYEIPGTFDINGNMIAFIPTIPLEYNTDYNLRLSGSVMDLNKEWSMIHDFESQFRTESAPTAIMPFSVKSIFPKRSAQDQSVKSYISLVFSDPIDFQTTKEAFSLVQNGVTVNGTYTSPKSNELRFQPSSPLMFKALCEIIVDDSALSLTGKPLLQEYYSVFSTSETEDLIPPQTISFTPADGVTDAPISTHISIRFDEGMDNTSVESAFSCYSITGNPVAGSFYWRDSQMIFIPDQDLELDQTYQVMLTNTAADLEGNQIRDEQMMSFSTRPDLDTEAPTILTTNPIHQANDFSATSNIGIYFSEIMDIKTTEDVTLMYLGDPFLNQIVMGSYYWNGSILEFDPVATLEYGQEYHVVIAGSASDVSGNTLSEMYTFTFQVATTPDHEPPVLENITVVNIRDDSAEIMWSCNEPASTLVELSLTTNFNDMQWARRTAEEKTTLIDLEPFTTYYYRIQATDASGNTGAFYPEIPGSFITKSDNIPPIIVSDTFPDSCVPITETFQVDVTFSELIWNLDVDVDKNAYVESIKGKYSGPYTISIGGVREGNIYTVSFGSETVDDYENYMVPVTRTFCAVQNPFFVICPEFTHTGPTELTVDWETNEPAYCSIRYAPTPDFSGPDVVIINQPTDAYELYHSEVLTGITPGTIYFYEITLNDRDGNSSTSSICSEKLMYYSNTFFIEEDPVSYEGWIGKVLNGGIHEGWVDDASSESGRFDKMFLYPYDVVSDNTYIYISDSGNHRIQRWTVNGNFAGWLGGSSVSLDHYAKDIQGAAMTGDTYVGQGFTQGGLAIVRSDNQDHKPYLYDMDFDRASGLALYSEGPNDYLLIADANHNRIQKWSRDGMTYYGWLGGKSGVHPNADAFEPANYTENVSDVFDMPVDIALGTAPNGHELLFVCNFENAKIRRFDLTDNQFITNDTFPTSLGLNHPNGIFVDVDETPDMLYIADSGNNRIVRCTDIYSATPTCDKRIGGNQDGWLDLTENAGSGRSEGAFEYPCDVIAKSVGGKKYLYIADTNNHRISKWCADAAGCPDCCNGCPCGYLGRTDSLEENSFFHEEFELGRFPEEETGNANEYRGFSYPYTLTADNQYLYIGEAIKTGSNFTSDHRIVRYNYQTESYAGTPADNYYDGLQKGVLYESLVENFEDMDYVVGACLGIAVDGTYLYASSHYELHLGYKTYEVGKSSKVIKWNKADPSVSGYIGWIGTNGAGVHKDVETDTFKFSSAKQYRYDGLPGNITIVEDEQGQANSVPFSFNTPRGLALDNRATKKLYVTDRNNHRVSCYTITNPNEVVFLGWIGGGIDGWHTNSTPADRTQDGYFYYPIDCDIDTHHNKLYVTYDNRVVKWDANSGTYEGWIGANQTEGFLESTANLRNETGKGEFYGIGHVAVYYPDPMNPAEGYLLVSDDGIFTGCSGRDGCEYHGNSRVQKWTTNGEYVGWIGANFNDGGLDHVNVGWLDEDRSKPARGNGEFYRPLGITIHPTTQTIAIVDSYNIRVQKWNAAGFYYGWIGNGFRTDERLIPVVHDSFLPMEYPSPGSAGKNPSPYWSGACYDASGNLYVVDYRSHRIHRW